MNIESFEYYKSFLKNKDNRKQFILFLFLAFLIIYLSMYASPKVYVTTNIKPVTEKDYTIFAQNNDGISSESKTRNNCRFLTVDIVVKKPFLLVRNIKINKDNLDRYLDDKLYFNKTVDEFHGLGNYYATDYNSHLFNGIDVYLDGMTDEKVKNFFGDYKIEILWVDLLNRKHKEYYYLKDYYNER